MNLQGRIEALNELERADKAYLQARAAWRLNQITDEAFLAARAAWMAANKAWSIAFPAHPAPMKQA